MAVVLFEAQYNPPIAFFAALVGADTLLLEAQEHYRKQTYRNRCLILTAQGVQPLTVPVVDGNRSEKVKSSEIEIDYRQNWTHRHWRTLQTAYGSSPYFEYYADYLHDLYRQKPALLFDFNVSLLHFYLKCLRFRLPVEFTAEYVSPTSHSLIHSLAHSLIEDRRDWLTPKPAAAAEPDRTSARPYAQSFGKDFVPGLSILDLLFMQGPAAGSFLA
ncbi:WbqC family protein [Hymenobacter weizhouensis]|uniref:WbqC family protein n=1 Tax=Hymenobacter sp. YIM 151500-1 TaxID=2987689 RepID=UPI0022262A18|nr:WbqC family protein [Hymenobacter sp. YIM 151500-1]UYZ65206.1 WbqC family protein [Hymenobacter sp. YIM 151500-1]